MLPRKFNGAKILLLFALIGQSLVAQNDLDADIQKLEKFLKNLDENYVDQVETKPIIEAGIKRMLEELDPHSVYFTKEAYERANEPLKGKFKGIGVRFLMIEDTMAILDVIEGGAAEKAGLRTGDKVISVNGDTVAGKNISSRSVVAKIKEDDGQEAIVEVMRSSSQGYESLKFAMVKSEVEVSSVPSYFMMDNRTGYLKLDRFSSTSLSDFREGLDNLKKNKAKDLVLDLRGNGGGYLNVAIKIIDEFLEDRKLIVYTEGEHQPRRETFATTGGKFIDGDLYVLIDANSASASEIFAGAVQDWDRGLIVGRRSYGKGLVQRTIEFNDGSAMRLTISRYYTPTCRSIQRPYDEGVLAYQQDLKDRRLSGELFSEDSIQINDSLIFFTPKNRKVYGGGGILPDVFVPLDSSSVDDYVRNIQRSALFDGYVLSHLDVLRSEVELKYTDVSSFLDRFNFTEEYMEDFRSYVDRRGISTDDETFEKNSALIKERMKVNLARFVYGYSAYFQAIAYYDEDVRAVQNEIERGTYKELGLK